MISLYFCAPMFQNQSNTFQIQLPIFEGPFDLLLFFIERDELDIYDIPISKITEDFLAYIRQMEAMNIDLASEFILVAATLMRIKAKLLLPRKPVDEEGNEIDPRQELVDRLIEYKRYKSILEEMRSLEDDRANRQQRGYSVPELKEIAVKALVDVELESLTLYKLLRAFEGALSKVEARQEKTVHTVYDYSFSIADQQVFILSKVKKGKRTSFASIFAKLESRIHAIVTFLALLDLLNAYQLSIVQGEGINNFWLEPAEPEEQNTDITSDEVPDETPADEA